MSEAENYLKAKSEFEVIQKRIHDFSQIMERFHSSLDYNPAAVKISEDKISLHHNATLASFDRADWRTIDDICVILNEWHKTRKAMIKAWKEIPSEQKEHFKTPPKFYGDERFGYER